MIWTTKVMGMTMMKEWMNGWMMRNKTVDELAIVMRRMDEGQLEATTDPTFKEM
jgi:hypothetical protein